LWAVRNLQKEPSSISGARLLDLERLNVNYGPVRALHDIDLSVARGTTVSLVGESGSGKSTLGRAIVGLQPPSSGRMAYDGMPLPGELRARDRGLMQRIQLIHQIPDTAMNPRHTVRKLLARPLELFQGLGGRDLDRAIIGLLERIELSSTFIDRLPNELSGGQKQRICIARALAARPELIICDEVTSALDQVVQEEILRLLIDIQKDTGMTYLFITHDIATVRAISNEVVVMHKGKVVERGSSEYVLNAPQQAYTKLLLSSVPKMDPDWLSGLLEARQKSPTSFR